MQYLVTYPTLLYSIFALSLLIYRVVTMRSEFLFLICTICTMPLFSQQHGDVVMMRKLDQKDDSGCQCVEYNCGCCAHFYVPKIGLDDTTCVNVSYLPDQYGISLTFSIDGKVYLNTTISAKNPPPLCLAIPKLHDLASICIDFYDLDIVDKTFQGCVKIQARLAFTLVEEIKLGCFKIPFGSRWQSEAEAHAFLAELKMAQAEKRMKLGLD